MIKRIKSFLKFNKLTKKVYAKLTKWKNKIENTFLKACYSLFCLLPLQDKVTGSSFYGKRYENNPRFVMEKLEEMAGDKIKKRWICKVGYPIETPPYVVQVFSKIRTAYEYATSKVWIDSHHYPVYVTKRDKQLAIIMFHGGIGIKKIANDVPRRAKSFSLAGHTARNTDFYVSNSDFMDKVIRTSLEYKGPIFHCGYPKDDPLFGDKKAAHDAVTGAYDFPADTRILLYAPTYRADHSVTDVYDVDFAKLKATLEVKFGGHWEFLVRWHPNHIGMMGRTRKVCGNIVMDATSYPNMQELLLGSDLFISDYSSCIFEAAEAEIPCFIYARDFDDFREEQGVYFELTDLPFTHAIDNEELNRDIMNYNRDDYIVRTREFFKGQGLSEDGTASEKVSKRIIDFIQGIKTDDWDN